MINQKSEQEPDHCVACNGTGEKYEGKVCRSCKGLGIIASPDPDDIDPPDQDTFDDSDYGPYGYEGP